MLSDKEEQTLQKLEIIGLGIYRCIKKSREHQYVMSRKYALAALSEVRILMACIRQNLILIDGGKNGK